MKMHIVNTRTAALAASIAALILVSGAPPAARCRHRQSLSQGVCR